MVAAAALGVGLVIVVVADAFGLAPNVHPWWELAFRASVHVLCEGCIAWAIFSSTVIGGFAAEVRRMVCGAPPSDPLPAVAEAVALLEEEDGEDGDAGGGGGGGADAHSLSLSHSQADFPSGSAAGSHLSEASVLAELVPA